MSTIRFVEDARRTLAEALQHLRPDAPEELRRKLADLEHSLMMPSWLTSAETAELLGVSSPNTIKNWLESGHFPGARRTPGGHWRFLLADVLSVKRRMEDVRAANASGALEPPDFEDDEPIKPLS